MSSTSSQSDPVKVQGPNLDVAGLRKEKSVLERYTSHRTTSNAEAEKTVKIIESSHNTFTTHNQENSHGQAQNVKLAADSHTGGIQDR